MGSSASKDSQTRASARGPRGRGQGQQVPQENQGDGQLPQSRSPLKTFNTQYTTGIAGRQRRNSGNVIIYRDKNQQQIPTDVTNTLIENVFLISAGSAVGEDLPEQCVLVSEVAEKSNKPLLTTDNVEEAVFERIMSPNPSSVTVKTVSKNPRWKTPDDGPCDEMNLLSYLYHCYVRWKSCKDEHKYTPFNEAVTKCKDLIFQHAKTCLRQPEVFTGQQIHKQFIDVCNGNSDLLFEKDSIIHGFLIELFAILESERDCLMECLTPVLKHIRQRFQTELKLMHSAEVSQYMLVLRVFTLNTSVAQVFMDFNKPVDWTKAVCYEATLIGSILSMNPCPKVAKGPYEFFNEPIDVPAQEINTTLVFIWKRVNEICNELYTILMGCIRLSDDLRHLVLNWLGRCIEANRGKPDLWSAHEAEVFDTKFCSDGFCLNMCHVLLQFCQPFSEPNSLRLLKVKPSYCRASPVTGNDRKVMCVHARGLSKEDPFVPYTEDSELPQSESYHFISECFFLTHQALHIGYNVVFKMLKLNSSIARMRKLYEQIKKVYPKRVIELVKQQLNREICWYLNIKAAITEYHLTRMCLNFHIATASWLVQVASSDDVTEFKPVSLPLDKNVPKSLSHLPQYIITNFTEFITPLDIFNSMEMITSSDETLQHYLNLMLVFMGDSSRLASSDTRAQLAEALENILPSMKEDGTWDTSKSGNTENVLNDYAIIDHLAEAVLNVFVSIEMTGQSVDEEKKFNYRRSMHKIIHYIWRIPVHKATIKRLSEKAVSEMGSPEPPLFLRFINLLINDAIFLLDEALGHMRQIREQEIERDKGAWNKLSAEQFRDKETGLRQLGMMGHYRNVMANHTIYTLELLAREIRTIFCHNVMVDRIAGMLNYFLEQLVGPKQHAYKVKDRKEYQFKPEQIVSDICHIYVYLGRDDQFCKAVLGESRSFSDKLFPQAVTVLKKIGVSENFLAKFEVLSQKLQSLENDHKHEEEMLADAPEEFLDPIMGTLMVDPVKLPTSNTNIDRAVLARHLLSDQRDPFTNLPLSMELVTANEELREKIEAWKMNHMQKPNTSGEDPPKEEEC